MRCPLIAGFPFIVLNTVCGSLAAYGFAGLRYTPSAIILFQVMLVLQSLAAVQLLILCVYATPTQACASLFHFQLLHRLQNICYIAPDVQLEMRVINEGIHRPCTNEACSIVLQYSTALPQC